MCNCPRHFYTVNTNKHLFICSVQNVNFQLDREKERKVFSIAIISFFCAIACVPTGLIIVAPPRAFNSIECKRFVVIKLHSFDQNRKIDYSSTTDWVRGVWLHFMYTHIYSKKWVNVIREIFVSTINRLECITSPCFMAPLHFAQRSHIHNRVYLHLHLHLFHKLKIFTSHLSLQTVTAEKRFEEYKYIHLFTNSQLVPFYGK